eukprot:GILJ01026609.1.p1 GENE.GILJ01026609.1~~GILJ01026609.1.p1  ORF type:complete len:216 (+),score=40.14 GILJ01026609.1:755-1402(+)
MDKIQLEQYCVRELGMKLEDVQRMTAQQLNEHAHAVYQQQQQRVAAAMMFSSPSAPNPNQNHMISPYNNNSNKNNSNNSANSANLNEVDGQGSYCGGRSRFHALEREKSRLKQQLEVYSEICKTRMENPFLVHEAEAQCAQRHIRDIHSRLADVQRQFDASLQQERQVLEQSWTKRLGGPLPDEFGVFWDQIQQRHQPPHDEYEPKITEVDSISE